jgi:hypothetical protein
MIKDDEKITKTTELDTWHGMDVNGNKIAITEVDLLEYTSLIANSQNENHRKIGEKLFESAKNDFYIEMPDGARMGKNIQALLDNRLLEVANDLIHFAKEQNIKNGYLEFEP